MRRLIVVAFAFGLAGCGEPEPLGMAATPESSRAGLVAALDGWKKGRSFQDLAGDSSPVFVQDDDLHAGAKLLDYKIETEGLARGTGYSYTVTLSLQDKDGAKGPRSKKVAYTIVTELRTAVTREDRSP